MNRTSLTMLIATLSLASAALAYSGDMRGMAMKDMTMEDCMGMMKGMDMKMAMNDKQSSEPAKSTVHSVDAVVKSVDSAKGKVTLAHEPIK